MTDRSLGASALLRRIGWRILPLLMLLYVVAYLDRVNIGFAASAMQRDLHFNDTLYGTGAGVFFLGYFLAQVPSNLLLARFGARRTIAVLMIVWSLVSASMVFVQTPAAFLGLRFLLGVAEAGFYPGVILYLTLWLPRRVRTSFTSWFIFAIPLASIFGGPLSTWILQHGSVGRLHDWQMLLLLQAAPAFLLGLLLPLLISDTPQQARWLSDQDRALLQEANEQDETAPEPTGGQKNKRRFGSLGHLLRFAFIYFAIQFALYAQNFWLPKILQARHVAERNIGWNVAAAYSIAAVAMIAWGKIADLSPKSRWTLGVPLLVGSIAYGLSAASVSSTTFIILAFGFGAAGGLSATAPFWAQTTLGQNASEVPALIAVVNALGNLGGFAGPALLGKLKQVFGSHAAGMLVASACLLAAFAFLYARRSQFPSAQSKAAA